MLDQLTAFLAVATPRERADLAQIAGVNARQCRRMAKGQRVASVELAARIEQATRILHRVKPHLPVVHRTDTCETCATCPHARAIQ